MNIKENLQQLMQQEICKSTAPGIFMQIADLLINRSQLITVGAIYRITDIEFYYKTESEMKHFDEYTHGDEIQKTFGNWYFNGYGLDLTIGDGINKGGVLLRGIQNVIKPEEYFDGPSVVFKELIKNYSAFNENAFPRIDEIKEEYVYKELFVGTRINLPAPGIDQKRLEFYDSNYRFVGSMSKFNRCKAKEQLLKSKANEKIDFSLLTTERMGFDFNKWRQEK
jgi:hypothetical protein